MTAPTARASIDEQLTTDEIRVETRWLIAHGHKHLKRWDAAAMDRVLTALDAATAERDAAQARVRELEARRCADCMWAAQDEDIGELLCECTTLIVERDWYCKDFAPRTEDEA